jgi:penicillin-binding protein 1C
MSRRGLFGVAALAAILLTGAAVVRRPYDLDRLGSAHGTSLILTDRHGQTLRVIPLPGGGRAHWVSLASLPPALLTATLAGEDHRFRDHHGVDGTALARAALLAMRAGRVVSGASTITMQLARLVQPHPRTLRGKLGEMIDALRLERTVSKDAILEQYLNRAYYGEGAFGVEEAARRFFGKSAATLSDGEACLLAVLPRAPRRYDPRVALADARGRRAHVLGLMVARGWLDDEGRRRIEDEPLALITPPDRNRAVAESPGTTTSPTPPAAHFCDWVLAHLPPDVRARGGTVRTTLDLALQTRLEAAVRTHLAARATPGLQAGVVVLDPADGGVRAMVGSLDHAGRRGGQVNAVTTRRHPGSALKPFIYALAIEDGQTPASRAHDTLDGVPAFRPRRTMRTHGVASYRDALAGSYNIAAVDVLDHVTVPAALERMRRAGLGPLEGTATDYGLHLALGAPRIRLLDLAAAYGFLVEDGIVRAPRFLVDAWAGAPRAPAVRIYTPEAAWLTMDMLADPEARRSSFGAELPLDLPFPVAAKTGTSSGFADTVAIGATREAVAAAWAGDFDGTGTKGTLAMWSAAPLVRAALLAVADLRGAPLTLPPPPAGVVTRDVCRVTGQLAGPACPSHREHFTGGHEPDTVCTGHPRPLSADLLPQRGARASTAGAAP